MVFIFTLEDTLVERNTLKYLSNTKSRLDSLNKAHTTAMVTNQPGVHYHHYLRSRDDSRNFGRERNYLSYENTQERLTIIKNDLGLKAFTAAYRGFKSNGTPLPIPETILSPALNWDIHYAMPGPGMILNLSKILYVNLADITLVGSSITHEIAANIAQVEYIDSDSFFGRD